MNEEIVAKLQEICRQEDKVDSLLYKGEVLQIDHSRFSEIGKGELKKVYFVDGGQAELLVAGNFCLQYLRVAAVSFSDKGKEIHKLNAYCLVRTETIRDQIYYIAELFLDGKKIEGITFEKEELMVSSSNEMIKSGRQRAPITKLGGIVRRFMELKLTKLLAEKDPEAYVILDGSLDARYPKEQEIIDSLPSRVCALAKTTQLFTVSGKNPVVYLNKICSMNNPWVYSFSEKLHFVKLHWSAWHVFRFDGEKTVLGSLLDQSKDPTFLGYPYGLILVDKLARVSEQEKSQLRSKFLLRKDLAFLKEHLASQDAHEILDRIG
ncbi:hypothetical protein CL619_03340 [archaeon]|nr:hypothetical protein [archaeon]|tara:strand:- start:4023 stop:4985 length:963 start_codon:yes stop_codon:yes gene_type:complete